MPRKKVPQTFKKSFPGAPSILTAFFMFGYAFSFFFISKKYPAIASRLTPTLLLLTGFFVIKVFIALYRFVRSDENYFAQDGLVLAIIGGLGMIVHGGYDLAVAIYPPRFNLLDLINLPSQIDPRGLLSFGIFGIAVIKFSFLVVKNRKFGQGLGYTGMVSGILLVVLYLGRLLVLNPSHPIVLVPAVLNGFIVGPVWFLWLGLALNRFLD